MTKEQRLPFEQLAKEENKKMPKYTCTGEDVDEIAKQEEMARQEELRMKQDVERLIRNAIATNSKT